MIGYLKNPMELINVMNVHKLDDGIGSLHRIKGAIVRDIMYTHGAVLGNPWYNRERTMALRFFKAYLWRNIQRWQERGEHTPVTRELVKLAGLVAAGRPLFLVCCCAPKPCHGNIIAHCIVWMVNEHMYEGS